MRACARIRRLGCRALPVLSEGRVLAQRSIRDLLRDEIQRLRACVDQTPPAWPSGSSGFRSEISITR
jgi:hypothetical protein